VITSQNHGFAWIRRRFRKSARDARLAVRRSLQGWRAPTGRVLFPGHPEAEPGPADIGYLFDRFAKMMSDAKA
jgi:carbamoyl-phosphate synthase small subunit